LIKDKTYYLLIWGGLLIFQIPDSRFQILDFRFQISDSRFQIPDPGPQTPEISLCINTYVLYIASAQIF